MMVMVDKLSFREKIIWMAGFMDADGMLGYTGNTQFIRLGQRKDKHAIDNCQAIVPGSRRYCKGSGMEYWAVYGPRARGLMMMMYPFLSPWRQYQARLSLAGVLPRKADYSP